MKRVLQALLVVKILFFFTTATAQQWMTNLPQEAVTGNESSFFEIQKAFNDYWAPMNVDKGYYNSDGKKMKAAGWKQFKRWEWFWNDRVDPETGAFPKTNAFNELVNYQNSHPSLKSTSGSATGNWTSLGPNSTAGGYAGLGRLNCVAFSPSDNNTIYVGAASGGMWKSTNGGTSWNPMSDQSAVLGISDLLVLAGTSGDVIYAATGDRDASDNYSVGVLKSFDGGNTWNTTGLYWSQGSLKLIYRLLGDPANADVLYAATSDGFYRTIDGGMNWIKLTTSKFINIKFKPGSNMIMYGSTISTGDIYRSENGGVSWSIVLNSAGTRVELAVTPANPEVVYAVISSTSNGLLGVYKSVTGGTAFNQVAGAYPNMLAWNCDGGDAGGQGWYDLCIAADPANADVVFVGGVNTWKSINGGVNWTVSNMWSGNCSGIATNVHADKHDLAYQPGTATLFECNDGGLYKTSNTGATWAHIGSGLVISQMYRLGVSQTNSGDVMAGLQDNGTKAMLSGTWKDVIGGDGMECLVDFTNTNVQYGALYYGDVYRTDNHWASSTYISGSLAGSSGWVTPYVIDPGNNNTLYIGRQDVWKTTNKGASWLKISSWAGATLRSLAVSPSNSNTIYAATGSIIYKTTDGGATWSNITGTLPVGVSNITYLSVKQDDPNVVWASFGQFNAYGVFQSADGGVSWTNISAGLPSIPVNCVIQNKQNTGQVELYAGTDVGVFMKIGQNDWTPYFTGLPNVVVMELEIYYASDPSMSKLRAATYGRGLWESELYAAEVINYAPVFSSDPVVEIDATETVPYLSSLADDATDLNAGDVLTFSLISGPSWLSISSEGLLSGTPSVGSAGTNLFNIKVTDGKGGFDLAILQINVSARTIVAPVADFSASLLNITVGQTVQFTDLSLNDPTSWSWSFGDGNVSTAQNPVNTYTTAGIYTVTLSVSNETGSDEIIRINYIQVEPVQLSYCTPSGVSNSSDYISSIVIGGVAGAAGRGAAGYNVYTAPVFSFSAGKTSAVVLTPYKTTNRDYWKIWIDFNRDGDFTDAGETVLDLSARKGKTTGSILIPVTASGTTRMRVAMRTGAAVNPCDNNFKGEVEDYPVVIAGFVALAPISDFSATNASVVAGQTVQFTDLSLNAPTGWIWDSGDGQTSGLQNPSLVYSTPGLYTVTLTTANSAGSHIYTRVGYIAVAAVREVSYCTPAGVNNTTAYINTVALDGSVISTGRGTSGYTLSATPEINLTAGRSVSINLTPKVLTNRYYWKVWIDFNIDGDFTDAGEELLSIANKRGALIGTMVIPSPSIGILRMRVTMRTSLAPNPCDVNFTGEVKDFQLNILKSGSPDSGSEITSGLNVLAPELNLYPNPVNALLNVTIAGIAGKAELHVFAITGSHLETIPVHSDIMQIDVSRYPAGVYYLTLIDLNRKVVRKFVKD